MPDQDLKPSQEEVGRSVHLRSCCHDLNIVNQISIMKPESKQQNPTDLRRRRNRLHSRGCIWPVAWKGTTIDHQEPNEQHQTNRGNKDSTPWTFTSMGKVRWYILRCLFTNGERMQVEIWILYLWFDMLFLWFCCQSQNILSLYFEFWTAKFKIHIHQKSEIAKVPWVARATGRRWPWLALFPKYSCWAWLQGRMQYYLQVQIGAQPQGQAKSNASKAGPGCGLAASALV